MPHSFRRFLFAVFFAALISLSLFVTGCNRAAPKGSGPLQLPADGYVNLISRPVKQNAETFHWKWSVLAERNWRKADAQGGNLSLKDVYPLNDVNERGGCNVWEVDLTVNAPVGTPATWEARLHGSVGTTVIGKGTADLKGAALASAVQILENRDTSLRLPVNVALARIGETEIRLTLAK